jgi:hypothetical protein
MAKWVADTVYYGGLQKLSTATRLTFCSAQPANFAGIAAVLLASKTITAGNLAADGTTGAYTGAADTTGKKLTVAAQTAMTPSANGTVLWACLDDGTTLLSATTVTSQAVTTSQSWNSPAFVPWANASPT